MVYFYSMRICLKNALDREIFHVFHKFTQSVWLDVGRALSSIPTYTPTSSIGVYALCILRPHGADVRSSREP